MTDKYGERAPRAMLDELRDEERELQRKRRGGDADADDIERLWTVRTKIRRIEYQLPRR